MENDGLVAEPLIHFRFNPSKAVPLIKAMRVHILRMGLKPHALRHLFFCEV